MHNRPQSLVLVLKAPTIGALVITSTIFFCFGGGGGRDYNYSIVGPKTLF